MSPRLAPTQDSNTVRGHGVISRYGCEVFPLATPSSNFAHGSIGQLGRTASLPPPNSAVTSGVCAVLAGGPPLEVAKSIVATISVEMATLHTIRGGASEGQEHKRMDRAHRTPFISGQCNPGITVGYWPGVSCAISAEYSPLVGSSDAISCPYCSVQRSNLTLVRDLIQSFPAGDISPFGGICVVTHAVDGAMSPASFQPLLG